MTGKLGKFYVEESAFGARLMVKSDSLTSDCLSPEEVDWHIRALKEDLDACAAEMNRINANRPASVFADEAGDA